MGSFRFKFLKREYEIKTFYFLLTIILLAVALRIYHLDYQSLWHDEFHSMLETDPDLPFDEMMDHCKNDQPPAHFLMLRYWLKVFGYSSYNGRLLSVVIGLLGVLAMFFLGKEFKNETTGLLCAFITSANYFHILYSQEARFYILVFLFSTLSYLYFLKSTRNQRLINYIGYVLTTVGLLYTHYFGLVVFLSQAIIFVAVFFYKKYTRTFFVWSMAAAISVVILISPWIPIFVHDNATSAFWILPLDKTFLLGCIYDYFNNHVLYKVFGLLFLYFLIKLMWRVCAGEEKDIVGFIVLFGWVLLGFMIPIIYSYVKMPMLICRYTMIVVPGVILCLALAIETINNRQIRTAFLIFILMTSIGGLFVNGYYTKIRNEQYREAALKVIQENKDNSIVFSYDGWFFNYYFKVNHIGYKVIKPWETDYKDELRKNKKVWVLYAPTWEPLDKELEIQNFKVKNDYRFESVRVVLYAK